MDTVNNLSTIKFLVMTVGVKFMPRGVDLMFYDSYPKQLSQI